MGVNLLGGLRKSAVIFDLHPKSWTNQTNN